MKNIAVIPARGGSKRIPQKNIIDFCGRPMISWTIEAALESNLFDRVHVSTDDETIADISKSVGAHVPFYRQKFNDDHSTASDATIASLIQYKEQSNEEFTNVVQLMPNCPLRNKADILKAWNFYDNGKHDFQISAFKFGWMNPWWAAKLSKDYKPDWIFPNSINKRSQDLEHLYCPTGAIWIAKVTRLLEHKTFYGTDFKFCTIDWTKAVDIDDYDDLDFAKAVAKLHPTSK